MKHLRLLPSLIAPAPSLRLLSALLLFAAPSLRAAEAVFVIDAGVVFSVDTATGAELNSFNYGPPPEGPGGIAFSGPDTLYIQNYKAGSGDRAYIYTASGAHGWTRNREIWRASGMTKGSGLTLTKSGTILGIAQGTHDLWSLQAMNHLAGPNVGRVRTYNPLLFPTHIAASPLEDLYATWFYNGTLLVTKGGTDTFTIPGFTGTGGICFDYTGYEYTDPGTQVTSTHSLLYISNYTGGTVRRYDAVTMQPYGRPGDRSNPEIISPGTSGMVRIQFLAVDSETGTLYCMGWHQNYGSAFGNDIVIAGFSTVDGTPRGLNGSTTDPVVNHRPGGGGVFGFAIRPGVQVQQYDGGSHTLSGSFSFPNPGKSLQVVNTGATAATVEIANGYQGPNLEFGGILGVNGFASNYVKALSQADAFFAALTAAIRANGEMELSPGSTFTATNGVTVTDGGLLKTDAGSTLNCPNGSVTVSDGGRLEAASFISCRGLGTGSGGVIAPGASPGTLTLQGDLDLRAGSTLEMEIGGTTGGSTHDLLDVQNAFSAAINCSLVPRLYGGFTPQAADTFTVVTSNVAIGGTIQNLNAGRVSTANGRGSFLLTFINGSTAIQLSDFQSVPPEQAWRNVSFSASQQADPLFSGDAADPDADGMNNLLEFALNSDPLSGAAPSSLPSAGPGGAFAVTRYSGGTTSGANYHFAGIRYVIQSSVDLTSWDALAPGNPAVVSWIVTPNADGITETVRLTLNGTRRLLRLAVTRP